jgi:AAA domain/RepB DNA-primase from phage plasmid
MTDTIVANTREVREFVETYVAQARAATAEIEKPGLLNMVLVNPADDDVTSVYRYTIRDPNLAERMISDAINASAAGHNVYVEGRTVRVGLIGKQRGELNDTIAVFALVVDSDNDKSKAWTPVVPTSLAIETSPGNTHFWFFLERAVDAPTGKALGDRLRAATSADADTGNVCQPYRVAGTVNYPGKKKLERGRVTTPTRSLGFDSETLWTPERFEQEFPDTKTNGGGDQANGAATTDESNIPADTLRVIREGVEDGARSSAFWNVVKVLKADGWTITGIVTLLDRFPNGIAVKYRGRLQREVERVWAKLNGGQQQQQPQQQQPKSLSLKFFDAITLSALSDYSIKGIFPRTGLAVVWGPPKSGKSFWTYDACMHICTGRNYRGRNVRKGTVVYCALEGGSGFAKRVEAWRRRHRSPKGVPFYLLDVPIDLVADHNTLVDTIRQQVESEPAVIVIDTLNRAMFGNENDSKDMGQFIRPADAVRTAFHCLMIVVHHCGVSGNRPRGHTSLAGADDAQIVVTRDKSGNVIAKVEFMKDAEGGAEIVSKLETVDLGTDAEGESLSSCVIVPAVAEAAEAKLPKGTDLALEVLRKLLASSIDSIAAPKEADLPAGTRVCRQAKWREHYYDASPAEDQGAKQKAFRRAHDALIKAKLIDFWRDYVFFPPNPDNPDIS